MKLLHMRQESRHPALFHYRFDQPHSFYLFVRYLVPAVVLLDGTPVTLEKGTVVVFDPAAVHDYRSASGEEFVHDYIQFEPVSREDHQVLEDLPLNTPLRIFAQRKLTDLMQLISQEYRNPGEYTPAILSDLHRVLLNTVKSQLRQPPQPDTMPHYETLYYLRDEIYRVPAKAWSLGEMSRCTHLSQPYLQALYREYFHISCGRDVIRARLRMAASLLRHTNLSIRSVGESCGYASQEHFIRQFRAYRGTTPLQYRKSLGMEPGVGKKVDGPGSDPV